MFMNSASCAWAGNTADGGSCQDYLALPREEHERHQNFISPSSPLRSGQEPVEVDNELPSTAAKPPSEECKRCCDTVSDPGQDPLDAKDTHAPAMPHRNVSKLRGITLAPTFSRPFDLCSVLDGECSVSFSPPARSHMKPWSDYDEADDRRVYEEEDPSTLF